MSSNVFRIWHIAVAAMLGACLFNMPYSYYRFVSVAVCFSCVVFAVDSVKHHGWASMRTIGYIATGLIFNPFSRPYLGRFVWNIVDVIVAAAFVGIVVADSRSKMIVEQEPKT